MRTFLPLVLAVAAILLSPLAAADETTSDCEEDQPWLVAERYGAQPVFDAVDGAAPGDLAVCEGEQWDGQDTVSDEPAACPGTANPDPILVGYCQPADPNHASGEDILVPVRFRASSDGEGEAYASANVALVGRVAVYGGACQAGDAGLEGEADCAGGGEARAGVYWRDNTPGNIVVQLTPRCFLSITGCYASESDCDYATWRFDQEYGWACGRDNTAVGVGLVLP